MKTLDDMGIKTGVKVRKTIGTRLPEEQRYTELWHVRGIVDGQAVVRKWSKRNQFWVYKVAEPYWFELGLDGGSMELA